VAVMLSPLKKLFARAVSSADDNNGRAWQRAYLIEAMAPSRRWNCLLQNASWPHTFVDHTHAPAVVSLIDPADTQTLDGSYDGRLGCALLGGRLRSRQRPGRREFDKNPKVEGLIPTSTAIFSFGASVASNPTSA